MRAKKPVWMLPVLVAAFSACSLNRLGTFTEPLAGAPRPVRRMVRRSLASPERLPYERYPEDAKAIRALGPAAAPWLARILDAPQSNNGADLQIRSIAAELLADAGRWEDLMTALESDSWLATGAADGPFAGRILNSREAEVSAFLPRIERVATRSPRWHSRRAAMGILAVTKDPRYVAACSGNLAYDSSGLLDAAPAGKPDMAPLKEALERFERICVPDNEDHEVRNHAVGCLVELGDPRALPLLFEIAEANNSYALRHGAIEALASLAGQDFGSPPPGNDDDGSHEFTDSEWAQRCEAGRKEVRRILSESQEPAEAAARVKAAAKLLVERARGDSERDPDARIVAGWRAWLRSGGAARRTLADEEVARRFFPATETTILLYGSGKALVSGPMPGGSGSATFTSLESLVDYIHHISALPQKRARPDAVRVGEWLLTTAIPELQLERKNKRPHSGAARLP